MAGVTSDATNIYVYDNTDPSAGGDGSYSFSDIFAVLGGTGVDILRIDAGAGSGFPTYRLLKNLQIGDTGVGTATTTLSDTAVAVTFDANKVLKTRTTQTSSWNCLFGTKIGSGNTASGKKGVFLYFFNTSGANLVSIRGTVKWYGVAVQCLTTGGTPQLQFGNQVVGASELVNCIFEGFNAYVLGSSGASLSNYYNVDISGDGTASNVTSFFVDSASRLTIGGTPTVAQLASASAGLAFKDAVFFGTPGSSDLRWGGGAATNWQLVRPTWSGSGMPKFSGPGPASTSLGAQEYWVYDVKIVDRNGSAVAGIPIKLTDADGNVQVNTVTGSDGQVGNFGSGLTANCVAVADHYSPASVYAIHHRSPFTAEINTGASSNPAYLSRTYKFNWPGYESITTTGGSFEDISDIVNIQDPSGGPTSWQEFTMP